MTIRERIEVEKFLIGLLSAMCALLIGLCTYVFLRVQSQIDTLNVGFVENRSRVVALEVSKSNIEATLGKIDHKLDALIERENKK